MVNAKRGRSLRFPRPALWFQLHLRQVVVERCYVESIVQMHSMTEGYWLSY